MTAEAVPAEEHVAELVVVAEAVSVEEPAAGLAVVPAVALAGLRTKRDSKFTSSFCANLSCRGLNVSSRFSFLDFLSFCFQVFVFQFCLESKQQ